MYVRQFIEETLTLDQTRINKGYIVNAFLTHKDILWQSAQYQDSCFTCDEVGIQYSMMCTKYEFQALRSFTAEAKLDCNVA